ncbi:iron-siderophore ABC transporter substrate-binding protein [Streptomyces sp. LP05-1]|uniref:Iron-siderophore ABC transporter substrate-binding protein n=1 Tax=Streptomyces pyxinae TaxID=2970734 RepID=A0ABT2CEN5_9ACTN|nr:iron-siderophore ABC transporter substrate-binding protein [Streptomyces sp. LP05-1]MCS0635875.1 iron-siderophore ABC transporter substrate-binding protein [Streptomyces sp. LP05-1]
MRRLLTSSSSVAAGVTAAALLLAGCGTTESAPGDSAASASASTGPVTVTDATGATVKLDAPATKVVGTEWNIVESLVSLGVDPVGVADVKGYKAWDSAVPLRNAPKDIGLRGEPSMDTVAALRPDVVIATTDLPAAAVTQLRKVAKVIQVRPGDAADPLGQMNKNLDLIARATGRTAQAATLKKSFETKLAAGKKALADAGLSGEEIAFADGYVVSNQVSIRPYTSGSLLGGVNEALGLKNAWTMKGDKDYGLATTDVEGLTGLGKDVRFAYIANDSDGGDLVSTALVKNPVWNSLAFVKAKRVHRLKDGIWMFGGPGSMSAYVDSVVGALTKTAAEKR